MITVILSKPAKGKNISEDLKYSKLLGIGNTEVERIEGLIKNEKCVIHKEKSEGAVLVLFNNDIKGEPFSYDYNSFCCEDFGVQIKKIIDDNPC